MEVNTAVTYQKMKLSCGLMRHWFLFELDPEAQVATQSSLGKGGNTWHLLVAREAMVAQSFLLLILVSIHCSASEVGQAFAQNMDNRGTWNIRMA
jgi:hypothetical protein